MATFVMFVREGDEVTWHSTYGPFESDKEISDLLIEAGFEYEGGDYPQYALWRHTKDQSRLAKVAYELTPPEKLVNDGWCRK